MHRCLVSFVVLNWNGLTDTLSCLESIRKQTVHEFEIIVVDNGSPRDQKDALGQIEDITFIDLPVNTGFTGGQIAALKAAHGEFIALINNDAVISPSWTEEALGSFGRHPKAAAVGGRAYQWDAHKGHSAFSTHNPFYSYQVINLITGHTRTLDYGDAELSVDSISGSGVLIKRDVIDKLGYFDDTFFAYYEETDLFARYKRGGFQIIYNPAVHTWHKIAQSTKSKPDFYLYHMHRNRFMFAAKNYDHNYMTAFLRAYTKEWFHALASVCRYGAKNRIEEKNLLKAGMWNWLHFFPTLAKRRAIQRLGASYSNTLLTEQTERISVVIPCYNYASYVPEAIESALNQTLRAYEIIVINDGSTDNSLEAIRHFQDRVTVIDQENKGLIKTKNVGLEHAKGDWIIYLDADDIMQPDLLERLYHDARMTNSEVAYSAMEFIGNESGIFWSRPFSRRSLRKGNYINNSALMRRAALEKAGGYKQAMVYGFEDWELYLSLAEQGARFRYVEEPLLLYRRHAVASRDSVAQARLHDTKSLIKQLHPRLFSFRYICIDFVHGVVDFWKQRTPMQMLRDIRYNGVSQLDRLSEHSVILNKTLGLGRLAKKGDFTMITEKIKLNWKRLWKQ